MELAVACERFGAGWLGQPVNTVTSLAFVVAGLLVLARHRTAEPGLTYPALVAAVGLGSVVQHGPHPGWQAYPHDLTLGAVLAFVAADAVADLTGRRRRVLWWLAPTAALAPLVALGHAASTAGQVGLAVAAIGLSLLRARRRPALRTTLLWSLAILALGAMIGTLGDRTAFCRPESPLQGHAVWHLLAAAALWRLAPAIGARTAPVHPGPVRPDPVG